MTLYDVSLAIRSIGHIWHIEYPDYGIVFRADVGKQKVRVVVLRPGQSTPIEIPNERNSLLFLVKDLSSLVAWLQSIIQPE